MHVGPSRSARVLGYGGLIPFVGLAAAVWLAPPAERPFAAAALVGYGATIASFLGAIHWGLAMRPGAAQAAPALLWGVTPSLLGWLALLLDPSAGLALLALLLDPSAGLALLALLLGLCLAVDRWLYPRLQLQAWLPLRGWLTLLAGASCLAAAVALQPLSTATSTSVNERRSSASPKNCPRTRPSICRRSTRTSS